MTSVIPYTESLSGNTLTIIFGSNIHVIAKAVNRCIEFCRHTGFKADEYKLKIVLHEALVNATVHGNQSNPNLKVTCSIGIKNNELDIGITDEGAGFVLDTTKTFDDEDVLDTHGRGIKLINTYCKNVRYKHNQLLMTVKGR